ncbi:MAG TPA: phosphatidate cytidylyltransferase [Geminicoccaceae bacterium]|nr:phosphatidate cytidylyltransferase [Geminicoccaceae bacterium]
MALPRADAFDPQLRARVASGAVLAAVVIVDVVLGGWYFALLVMAAIVLMAYEWAGLAANAGRAGQLVIGIAGLAAPVLGVVWAMRGASEAAVGGLAVAAVLAAGTAAVLAPRGTVRAGLGVLYLGLPAVALVWLRNDPDNGRAAILWLLLVVWTTDIAAYFVGRAIGGRRLAPRISPGKTWAGLLGGMTGAAVIGAIFAWAFGGLAAAGAAVAALLAAVAQAGDLFESWIKRVAGVKDSGHLIPGHGGVLDRLDGLLFAAPAFAVFAALAGVRVAP